MNLPEPNITGQVAEVLDARREPPEGLERGMELTSDWLQDFFRIYPDRCASYQEGKAMERKLTFAVLSLGKKIEEEFANRGDAVALTYHQGGIQILTYPEQVQHCEAVFRKARGSLRDVYRKAQAIPGGHLSSEQQQRQMRLLTASADVMQRTQFKRRPLLTNKAEGESA